MMPNAVVPMREKGVPLAEGDMPALAETKAPRDPLEVRYVVADALSAFLIAAR